MSTNFTTRLRSWLLIAGLSGLLIAIGAVIGGGALYAFVALTVAFNVAAIANFLQFSLLFGGGDDDESPLGFVGALATIILAPLAAMLVQLAVSRQREYLADATGARILGQGRPLADALESIHARVALKPMAVNPATEALYIANPLAGVKGTASLFSTHPPVEERVRRLRQLDRRLVGELVFAA